MPAVRLSTLFWASAASNSNPAAAKLTTPPAIAPPIAISAANLPVSSVSKDSLSSSAANRPNSPSSTISSNIF